jgi:hypothetical protein
MLSLSLGAMNPRPNTCLGIIKKPVAAMAVLRIKLRRDDLVGAIFSFFRLAYQNERTLYFFIDRI